MVGPGSVLQGRDLLAPKEKLNSDTNQRKSG